MQRQLLKLILCLFLAVAAGCQNKSDTRSPEKALATFELPPGFQIEQVASEPQVSDPVDMTIDEEGRLYVVEMHGYPLDKSGSDRIKLLRDTNGDGRMDEAAIFADSLVLPTGIMRWKQGVLVTMPPNVWYMEDSDGDGRADIKKKILTGFAFSNPQHNVNSPVYGLNNWIYLAHGVTAGTRFYPDKFGDKGDPIYYPDHPQSPRLPQNAGNRDVRFRPDTYGLKMLSGQSQFGQTFGRWGARFLVTNSNHIFQEVIGARYLRRNPNLLVPSATKTLSDHGQPAKVFPMTKNPEYQLLTNVGVFTSAGGIKAYLGGAFPDKYNTKTTFVTESVSNVVHADRLKDKGASFTASRIRSDKEFLASTDAWFRPVNMYIGPDGALYVMDYYRQIIEHPEWMSKEVVESGNLYNGSHKGRIYRITREGTPPARWTQDLDLGEATDKQLAGKLAHPNIWWRRNAQRLLVDRGSAKAVPALEQMAGQDTSAVGRLHALWTLEGLEKLRPSLIRQALQDSVAGVRANAVQLAELHLNDTASLTEALLAMGSDPNPKVRYQLLSTLGSVDTPQAAEVRQKLLFKDIDSKWVQIAALSSPYAGESSLLDTILRRFQPSYSSLLRRLSAMRTANQPPGGVHALIQKATHPGVENRGAWQPPMLEGIAEGLASRENLYPSIQKDQHELVQAFFEHPSAAVRQACLQVLQVTGLPNDNARRQAAMRRAADMAGSQEFASERREEALHLLALGDPAAHTSLLKKLINSGGGATVQVAAVQALSAIPGTMAAKYILKHWSSLTPRIRDAAIQAFLSRPDRAALLLDAIQSGTVQPGSMNYYTKLHLMNMDNDSLRQYARSLLAGNEEQNQREINRYVKAARQKTANPAEGRRVFLQHCAMCHHMENVAGVEFGPDLGTVKSWHPANIITNTVDPNKSIASGYGLWRVELKTGKVRQGIISTQSSNSITLRSQRGEETAISRQKIESLTALEMSAMPADFKEKISPQEMANLVVFIKQAE